MSEPSSLSVFNFSPANQDSSFDNRRLERSFEELITERGEDFDYEDTGSTNIFNGLYDTIQDKIFVGVEDEHPIHEIRRKELEQKYNIKESHGIIKDLKNKITELYFKKMEHSAILHERQSIFEKFCTHIQGSIRSIEQIVKDKITPEDIHLKTILQERINWYYAELDIENLIEIEYNISSEFAFLRRAIKDISGMSLTLCPVCMENQVSWFVDPCGHALCEGCKFKTEKNRNCHYCRTPKTKFNRLFL